MTSNGFHIRRGTSISHLFIDRNPPCRDRSAYFTESDIRYILGLGFDHVRISISEDLMWLPDGEIDHGLFSLLDEKISATVASGLRVVLCIQELRSHHRPGTKGTGIDRRKKLIYAHPEWVEFPSPARKTVPRLFVHEEELQRFGQCWFDLSERFRHIPTEALAYELLNEPFAPSDDDWHRVWRHAYSILREREPNRMIVVGANFWQIPEKIKRLDLPKDDRNVLPSFHLYYPSLVTHYRASWLHTGDYAGPVRYPGRPVAPDVIEKLPQRLEVAIRENNQPVTKQLLRKIIMDVATIGQERGHSLHCGEFGCIHSAPPDVRQLWLGDVVELFEEFGIAWTQWDWKGNYGILDKQTWKLSGIEKAMGLFAPRWTRPPYPGPSLWRRLRRRLRLFARLLGLQR